MKPKYNWLQIKASLFLATIVAALIGVNVFNDPQVSTVANRADAIEAELTALGFKVVVEEPNSNNRRLPAVLDEFVKENKGADLVFFSGHGVQTGGRKYLLPSQH